MLVVQSRFRVALAVARGADEDRTTVDLRNMQPLLESLRGAGVILKTTADLNFAPTGLGIDREEGTLLKDLVQPPEARVPSLLTLMLTIFERRSSGISKDKDCPIPQRAQILLQGADHREDVFG